ncbi:hypothetical protein Poli38472_005810 [Pythium oligandrum]|uniref:Uncharacterized protein n=1 Tax=Pythium oligandrum TaxID=41045 RepID=A0A8K1FQV2_PYTOL|nr:hypothetical protein Poli38472_005810 [Pythium oligandrum]|eukprot:TMW68342.1 hypothetical protein Poli38472_005810 [Pythium oligandrum]
MQLRTRNQFVLKARSAERTHALPLYVHVRECDLPHFREKTDAGVDLVQTLFTLLDGDAQFQALIYELDNARAIDDTIKKLSNNGNTLFHLSSDTVQVQWFVQDHPHGLVNILQRSTRSRSECFRKKAQSESEEEYVGGMYRPLPVRKLGVTVWMYPPHVTIPPTGDRVPANPSCVTEFFHTQDES